MFSPIWSFAWQRPARGEGFAAVPCREESAPESREFLALVPRSDAVFSTYEPLRLPVALYRELAETEPTEAGIVGFANCRGWLGLPSFGPRVVPTRPAPGVRVGVPVWGEDLFAWRVRIAWLSEAVRLWDLVLACDEDALGEVIRWQGERADYHFSSHVNGLLGRDQAGQVQEYPDLNYKGYDLLRHMRGAAQPGHLVRPATQFVLNLVNEELPRNNGPRLYWDDRNGKVVHRDTPNNLLGAVWLQFSEAIHSGKQSRRCRECGKWFEVKGNAYRRGGRSDKLLCSTSCRSRAYRQRQERARQLAREGKKPAEISRELGCEVKIVKGWLNKEKGK
jgi:hypothetical protein